MPERQRRHPQMAAFVGAVKAEPRMCDRKSLVKCADAEDEIQETLTLVMQMKLDYDRAERETDDASVIGQLQPFRQKFGAMIRELEKAKEGLYRARHIQGELARMNATAAALLDRADVEAGDA